MRIPLRHLTVVIEDVGATDNAALGSLPCSSVSVIANPSNSGLVYIGDHTVTNASGTNPGAPLNPGASISNISIDDLGWIYGAADTANDEIIVIVT
jgi:hypothetical protein